MTVLHYTGYTHGQGGIVTVIRTLRDASREVLYGMSPGGDGREVAGLACWVGPTIAGEEISVRNFWRARLVARAVQAWLRAGPDRVFHGHSRAGLLVALWLRLLREKRVVVSVHCYGRHRWFYRLASSLLGERLVWLTPAMKRHYGLRDVSWAGCVPNGLTTPWAETMRRWPGGRPLRIGGAGLTVPWKRWDLMLAALARLPADRAVEFYHIGGTVDSVESRDCEAALRKIAGGPQLAGRVHWLGWQDSSAALLNQVDVVVVPSDGEPFSMIALEAWFAGRPVIATRGGGPDDFIVDGENGWLVPAGDVAALAARLEKCLDPVEWQSLRMAPARLGQFSMPATQAAQWKKIYSALG